MESIAARRASFISHIHLVSTAFAHRHAPLSPHANRLSRLELARPIALSIGALTTPIAAIASASRRLKLTTAIAADVFSRRTLCSTSSPELPPVARRRAIEDAMPSSRSVAVEMPAFELSGIAVRDDVRLAADEGFAAFIAPRLR